MSTTTNTTLYTVTKSKLLCTNAFAFALNALSSVVVGIYFADLLLAFQIGFVKKNLLSISWAYNRQGILGETCKYIQNLYSIDGY